MQTTLARCEVDARGGYAKQTALMLRECTTELADWLLEHGADIEAADQYGSTALHHAVGRRGQRALEPAFLISRGADVRARNAKGATPLHDAAGAQRLDAVTLLLAAGADIEARNSRDRNALECALEQAQNIDLIRLVPVVETLLAAMRTVGAEISEAARELTVALATNFDFHRAAFRADLIDDTAVAVSDLCSLIGVDEPTARRVHDGVSPIIATGSRWQDQHRELWELLVPSSGASQTVQGEVIRISGRLGDEIQRNGGANWDQDFRAIARAFAHWIESGHALAASERDECRHLIARLPGEDSTGRLAELATIWVAQNPEPAPLPPPDYRR